MSPAREEVLIRPIAAADSTELARIVRDVTLEMGVCGPGTARDDPEVDALFDAYSKSRHLYLVAEWRGTVQGGAGIGPLRGGDPKTCELRKMYLRPALRGLGVARDILAQLIETAPSLGFERCYLETMRQMEDARRLYLAAGFEEIEEPLGDTGHFTCNSRFLKVLRMPNSG